MSVEQASVLFTLKLLFGLPYDPKQNEPAATSQQLHFDKDSAEATVHLDLAIATSQ